MITKPKTLKPYWVKTNTVRHKKKEPRYNTNQWHKLSARVRSEEPWCKYCEDHGTTQVSEVADHIIPAQLYEEKYGTNYHYKQWIEKGNNGTFEQYLDVLFFDRSNLCGCCKKCNLRKKRYQTKLN